MKKSKLLIEFLIIGLVFILTVRCDSFLDVDPCLNPDCENGAGCIEGICICPNGFIGVNCQNFDPRQIQGLLSSGITPFELLEGDIPLDSLYGKRFQGGLIFYVNTDDGTGLITSVIDQTTGVEWGCFGNDITGLPNISSLDVPNIEIEEGARIGDGVANTDAILMECTQAMIAASIPRLLGPEWFLPARETLNLMWENLADSDGDGENTGPDDPQNLGRLAAEPYWSSTEGNSDESAWSQSFSDGLQVNDNKNMEYRVRGVRAF